MTRHDQRASARKDPQMSTRPVGRRGLFLGAGSVLATGLLAACGSEPAPPADPPTGKELAEPTPVQTTEQIGAIVPEVSAAVVAADEARDVEELSPRVTGSAVDFRKAAYTMIEEAEEWADYLDVPGTELIVPMTSVTADFPRTAIALVEDSVEEDGVPYFLALHQEDAKSPYTSWGWAQQAVGIDMPMVANELVGAEQVARDDDALVMTPDEALSLYAKVLTGGDGADPDDQLADDPFTSSRHEDIQSERSMLNEGVDRDEAATIREEYTVSEDEFVGLRTDDGGAIIMGTLTSTRKVSVKERATVSVSEDNLYAKVIGKHEFTSEYIRKYGTHVTLYVPSAEDGGQVQPIGATLTTLSATGE
ncbi:hypothetical protein ACT3SP_15470 [Brachybacterium sp. AOP43-C2-M15]|uniref:hypothetical protein n=1 Tax=Brachybacterium sp. AOP43-C2-M15 TaxID=3457661 RepID=UPI004034E8AF